MPEQILFIQPPVEDFYTTDCRTQPVGLAYLAASIRQKFPAMDVVIYDALSRGKKKSIPWPPEFEYLKPYYGAPDKSPFKLFHQYFRFGKTDEEMLKDFQNYDPFLIGISSLFSPYYRQSLRVAEICRKVFPEAKIVMGGNHATTAPHSLLQARSEGRILCDYVIPGEAEGLITELVAHLTGSGNTLLPPEILLAGKYKKGDPVVLKNPPVDQLPMPEISALKPEDYQFNRQPMSFLITSRGCPYRCSFCGIHSVFGNKYKRRKNEDILCEIKTLAKNGIRHIDIEDDHFTANKKATLELLDSIIKENLSLTFSAMNGLVYWTLDEELLQKMKQAGFSSLNLSLVSKQQEFYKNSTRPDETKKFRDIVKLAAAMKFQITAYFIAGRPGQTIEEMTEDLCFLAGLPVLIGASPYYLSPGTPDYLRWSESSDLRMASQGKDSFLSARLTAMDIETQDFTREDIYTIFRLTRIINYVKKGIDLGYPHEDGYYNPVRKVFQEKMWYAETPSGKTPLPISTRVIEKCIQKRLIVQGCQISQGYSF